jgi:4-hydroxy-3-polyprenylbenzoate decarboxylase
MRRINAREPDRGVSMSRPRRMIVGVSGATGIVYAAKLLEVLRDLSVESHLVVTKPGEMTTAYETEFSPKTLKAMADVVYASSDIGAAISSGSYRTMGMVVAPCSVRTVAEIAACTSSNLLTRAADVCLKERRRLVLLVREAPLHAGHLKAMLAATEAGAIIFPPVPALYAKPATLEQMVEHTVGRVLDLFDLETDLVQRWTGADRQESQVIPLKTEA